MKLKENLIGIINKMNANELAFLYEYVKLLERKKRTVSKRKQRYSINHIHKMTESSKSSWSHTIIREQ